jgi:hypothetical protein
MLIVIAISGGSAYWKAFTSVTIYDDEGTMMLPLRQFQAGAVLYDQVVSIYGPLFFIYESIPQMLTGAPVSHDSVRMITAILRVASGLVFFVLAYRVTGSLLFSLAAHLIVFRALRFIGIETAHPQEICILLLLAVLLAATARRQIALIFFGLLCSAMALSKINVGIFAVASLAVVLSMALPHSRVQRALSFAVALAAVALPFALMRARLDQASTLRLALLAFFSIAAALKCAGANEITPVHWRPIALGVLSGVIGGALITSIVLARGTTIHAMVQSLLIIPSTGFIQDVNITLPLSRVMIAWSAVNLALAWIASRKRLPALLIDSMKLALGLLVSYFVFAYEMPKLIGPAAPMLWLVAAPGGRPTPGGGLLRPLMAVLSAITVLYTFPVAGWQTAFVSVPIVACATLCVWDTLPRAASIIPPKISRVVPAGVLAAVMFMTLLSAWSIYGVFRSCEPLDLPGATHLRLDPELTKTFRRLNHEAKSCSMLATLPGLLSFNLFSGTAAPKGIVSGAWVLWLDDATQIEAVREMESVPRPCAIYCPKALDIWIRDRRLASTPLVKYIMNDLPLKFESNGYRFMGRGDSAVNH